MFKLAVTLLAAALVTPLLGQDTSQIPACILNCTTTSLSAGGCLSITDLSCICTSVSYQTATGTCIAQNCPDLAANATAIQEAECAALSGNPTSSGSATATDSSSIGTTSNGSSTTSTSSDTANVPTNSDSFLPSRSSKSKTGAIVGGVVGGILVIIALVAIIFGFLFWRSRRRETAAKSQSYHADAVPEAEQKPSDPEDYTQTSQAPWAIPTSPAPNVHPSVAVPFVTPSTPAPTFVSTPPEYRAASPWSVNSGSRSISHALMMQGPDGAPYYNDELGRWANDNRDMISPELEQKLRDAHYRPSDNPDEMSAQEWKDSHGVGHFELKRIQELYERRSTGKDIKSKDIHASGQGGPSWRPSE